MYHEIDVGFEYLGDRMPGWRIPIAVEQPSEWAALDRIRNYWAPRLPGRPPGVRFPDMCPAWLGGLG